MRERRMDEVEQPWGAARSTYHHSFLLCLLSILRISPAREFDFFRKKRSLLLIPSS
jgi:hypothetical protein